MKKRICLLLAMIMVLSHSLLAFAAETDVEVSCPGRPVPAGIRKPTKAEIDEEYVLAGFSPNSIGFITDDSDLITTTSTISVPVTEPCDKSWRTKYPNSWMWEANRIVQAADDMLTQKFGIRFYSVSQKYWNHNVPASNPSAMVRDAHMQWGLQNGAKLMIAFTDLDLRVNGYPIFGLVEAIGQPYVLATCYGFIENRMTVRHEVAHCYGLTHCSPYSGCVVAAGAPVANYDHLCNSHHTQWEAAKNMY
jgi:hypothetical protein